MATAHVITGGRCELIYERKLQALEASLVG
jgi:hypothetical protein